MEKFHPAIRATIYLCTLNANIEQIYTIKAWFNWIDLNVREKNKEE